MRETRQKLLDQIDELEKTLFGMRDIIKIYCLSKATDLTILLLGAHATAKSSLARLWSITTGLNYRVVTSCFDEATEVLTEEGWKNFKDISMNDKLATLNLKTHNLEFQKPEAIIKSPYSGQMLRMKARWIDLLVTPNHKMVVFQFPFASSSELQLREVQDLKGKSKRFLKTCNWIGIEKETFDFPCTTYLKKNKKIKEVRKVPIEAFLKFLGYYLAEGSYDSHKRSSKYGGYFYRTTIDLYDKALCLDCKHALEEMGFKASLSKDGMSVLSYSKQLFDYVKQFGHAKEKYVPKEVKALSPRLLKIFWESWNRGDGHKVRGHWKVGTTVSKRLADDLQEIALKIGLSAKVRQEPPHSTFLKGRKIRSAETYRILASRRNLRPRATSNRGYGSSYTEEWIQFSGMVYCAEVPNHTLYVRRNGIPIWSGNSEVDESLIAYIDPAVFREKNIVQMRRGELMEKNHIIIDEYFLWLNKYRAKLHQLLEEKTYAGLDSLVYTYTFLCLDAETEALTANGWKRYSEILPSDKVLSLNPKSNMLEWSPVLAKWEYDYDGSMVSIEDRDLSSLTTLNHRFLVKDKRRTSFQWRLASDLKRQRDLIPQARNVSLLEKQERISDDQVRLMAWLKTEGRLKPGNTLSIYQSEGPYVDEIEALLSRMKLTYRHSSRVRNSKTREHQWTIYAKSGKVIKELVKDKIVRISDLELMTPKQLEIFYDTLIKGDGWRAEKQRGWEMFCSKHKESMDTFQFLATLLGKRCVVKERKGRINNGPRKGQMYSMWYAYVPQIKKDHLIRRYSIVPYKGKIWCLTTQLGNFLVRRHGKVHITGNSNPLSDYYAGQIEERNAATLDRIDLFVPVNQPQVVPSETMLRKFSKFGRKERPLEQVITWDEYLKAREEINKVTVPPRVVIWLTLFAHSMASCKHVKDKWAVSLAKMKKLCGACNENSHLCGKVLLSKPRFLRATIILAKGLAWLGGRDTVSFQDINEAIRYTLPHRIVWIGEELSYTESLEAVPELLQQFNDEMLAWKNRGIFSSLSQIIDSSKKVPPVFEEKIGQDLLAEVSEIHLLKDFVTETLQSVKADIAKFYLTEGAKLQVETLSELKTFIEQSGLSVFDRDELLYKIASENNILYYSVPAAPENLEKLVDQLIILHKKEKIEIDPKPLLMRKFSEAISFDSDLIKLRETEGNIQILFKDKTTRDNFLKLGSVI